MWTELVLAGYAIGVAVDAYLYGKWADFTKPLMFWRACAAALLWPLTMWVELGYKTRR